MKRIIILTLILSIGSVINAETFVNAAGMEESRLSATEKPLVTTDVRLGIPNRPVSEAGGYRTSVVDTPKAPITDSPEVLAAISARASGQSYSSNFNAQNRPQTDQDRRRAVTTDEASFGKRSENLQNYRTQEGQNYRDVPLRPAGAETGSMYRN